MFRSASENAFEEIHERERSSSNIMSFGIEFLDHALRGIFPDDLVLIGAPSGVGKTGLCCNIAQKNLEMGKRVHYIALEAAEHEIERRIKFPFVVQKLKEREIDLKIKFSDWISGAYLNELAQVEIEVANEFAEKFENLFLHYKESDFGLTQLIESVSYASSETDLIIIDHVHYFDFDDENENRAIKKIAKTVRHLAIDEGKPIILVAHLRKRDRGNDELIAGLDEFMGTSDLYKVATRVITVAPGDYRPDGGYDTFFRIPKNRWDGGVTRFSGKEVYEPSIGGYRTGSYEVGKANQFRDKGFVSLEHSDYPDWAKVHLGNSIGPRSGDEGKSGSTKNRRRLIPNYAVGFRGTD